MSSILFHKEEIGNFHIASQVVRRSGSKFLCRLCGNPVYNNQHELTIWSSVANENSMMTFHRNCAEQIIMPMQKALNMIDASATVEIGSDWGVHWYED